MWIFGFGRGRFCEDCGRGFSEYTYAIFSIIIFGGCEYVSDFWSKKVAVYIRRYVELLYFFILVN